MSRNLSKIVATFRAQVARGLLCLPLAVALVLLAPSVVSAQESPPVEQVGPLSAFGSGGLDPTRPTLDPNLEAYLFERLRRSRRVTRAGTYMSTIGYAAFAAGALAFAATSTNYDYYDDTGMVVSFAVMGLGFASTWSGSVMWGAGVLGTANALNDLRISVPRGAGIAALACGSVSFSICTWVAAPIQTSINRQALFNSRYASRPQLQWAVVPTRLGQRAPGLVLAARF